MTSKIVSLKTFPEGTVLKQYPLQMLIKVLANEYYENFNCSLKSCKILRLNSSHCRAKCWSCKFCLRVEAPQHLLHGRETQTATATLPS